MNPRAQNAQSPASGSEGQGPVRTGVDAHSSAPPAASGDAPPTATAARRVVLRAAVAYLLVTTAGRALGLARDLVLARTYGATAETDAFSVAWMIPETVTPLLLEGALIFALVPLFARAMEDEGSVRPLILRSVVPVSAALLAAAALVAAGSGAFVASLSPGLDGRTAELASSMVAMAASCVLTMGFAGYMRAALNAAGVFGVTGGVYAAYNAGILLCVLGLSATMGIVAAAVGLVVGGTFMVLVQLPAFLRLLLADPADGGGRRSGRRGHPFETRASHSRRRWRVGPFCLLPDRALLGELSLILPIGLFAVTRHAQVYAERFFGSYLEPGAISHLGYATRLGQLPMTTAITVAAVGFAAAARAAHGGRRGEVEEAFVGDLRSALALVAPAVALLLLFPHEVVGAFFGRGAFGGEDVVATADTLRAYSLGLFGHACVYVAALPFFNYRRSFGAAVGAATAGLVVTAAVDAALVFGTAGEVGAVGLALGNAAGITATAVLLLLLVRRRLLPQARFRAVVGAALRTSSCAAAAALPAKAAASGAAWATGNPWGALLSGGFVFAASYGLLAHRAGLEEADAVFRRTTELLRKLRAPVSRRARQGDG